MAYTQNNPFGVVPVTSPQVTALPTGTEIAVPFQIDPATGSVATLNDYGRIAAQHIETVILTCIGERVMLPTYGTRVSQSVFEPINNALNAVITTDIQKALSTWEPSINILSIKVNNDAQTSPTAITVNVEFSVLPYNNISTVTVTSGGSVQQVIT
jgi:phage baseplate assembly protein W